MNCATCKSEIEIDSLYCDQCGKEIFICPTCGKAGKGKNCVEDGGKLFSPKQKSLSPAQIKEINQSSTPLSVQPNIQTPNPIQNSIEALKPISPSNLSIPALKLVNNNLKIDIDIKNGSIIGRTFGEYVDIFSQYTQVSGRHLQFIFDDINGWNVIDLGSTNGTAINHVASWKDVPKLIPNKSFALNNNSFLLIANIEFQVKIILPQLSTPTGTQRL